MQETVRQFCLQLEKHQKSTSTEKASNSGFPNYWHMHMTCIRELTLTVNMHEHNCRQLVGLIWKCGPEGTKKLKRHELP